MPEQLPDGTWLSDDRGWRFLRDRWEPVTPPISDRPLNAFWFLSSPNWLPHVLLMGTIALLPFVGLMNLYGWALATADNLRAGYRLAAPPGLHYLRRGAGFVVWSLALGLAVVAIGTAAGVWAGMATYGPRHEWIWGIAIGLAVGFTVAIVLNVPLAPLMIPVLRLIDRQGLAAGFSPRVVVRALAADWEAAWLGVLVELVFSLTYTMALAVVQWIPLVGPFLSLAAAVPAYGLLALLLAWPLATAGRQPPVLSRTVAGVVAAGFLALQLASIGGLWAGTLVAAAFFSTYQDEIACVLEDGCNFSYAGSTETITRTTFDADDPRLVRVSVTYINRGATSSEVDPGQYWLSPVGDHDRRQEPSSDCPSPSALEVNAHSRVTQQVCFRLPDGASDFDIHTPWTGWDYRTPTRPGSRSTPSP